MSRLLSGALIILFVLLLGAIVTAVSGSVASGQDFSNCSTSNNITECENVGKGSFFSQVADVTFAGGIGGFFGVLYSLIMGLLLTVGILLIVLAFIPLTAE